MSRPAMPTQLHEIKGSYTKDPQRRKNNNARPKRGIGPCPIGTSSDWRSCWDELVDLICPGVLGDSDRIWLERAAKLLAESRDVSVNWTGAKESALQSYLSKMGLNPSDRARLSVAGDEDEDPADAYF